MPSSRLDRIPAAFLLSLLLLAAATGTSCAPQELYTEEIKVGDNRVIVEIAATPEDRSMGLMHRKKMDWNRGMLFVFDTEHQASFWMKNTILPLSIAFIASDGTIRQIEDMEPESLESVKSRRNVLYALEMNRGWFKENGVQIGDMVDIPTSLR